MKRLRVGVVELLAHAVTTPWLRKKVLAPGTASVMPQAVAAWAEAKGCEVHYAVWTAQEDLLTLLPPGLDVVFISAFTRASFIAYALSAHLRRSGTVTVLGGPHAMAFAPHAAPYFDVICQTTDRALVESLLEMPERHAPAVVLSSQHGPEVLPTVGARSRFIQHCLDKGTQRLRVVPLLGSLGCPYTCSFCVDASEPWQGQSPEALVEELRTIEARFGPDTVVGWHDPNFGVRFDDFVGAIEVSRTRLLHGAHMSLSLLSADNARRLGAARFGLIAPGVESWFDFSDKSGRAQVVGEAKVRHVASLLNGVTQHVEHVQTNFIVGLDTDEGPLPWELSRQLVELAPGAYPTFFLVTNYYNAPLSQALHASGRTLAVPFPLLDTNSYGNVRPLHYSHAELLERLSGLYAHAYSWKAVARRTSATPGRWGKLVNFSRSVDEGRRYIEFHRRLRERLDEEPELAAFYDGRRRAPPRLFLEEVRAQLGPYASLLPDSLLSPEGWAESFDAAAEEAVTLLRPARAGQRAPSAA